MPAVNARIVHREGVHLKRLVRVILNDDENGKNAILIGVQFPERGVSQFFGVIRGHCDGHLVVGLLGRVG